MKERKSRPPTPIETTLHKDRRTNIPTEELRDFVVEDENKPKTIVYPRDPSLDPQLVWKGKDEQDSKPLEVPAVPVYIQEKIHPKHIIEDLRAQAKEGRPAQLDLFADFNGLQFEELVEFYQHDQNWTNRMILGDSLLVLTSLAEKEGLKGKVQMIYIDPPYGISFNSNWQVSTRKRDVKDGRAEDATRQPEQVKAFRDTWKLGIHSYLAYLRDRLVVARDLLTETGSVFVQIGDENVHLVRCLMDEVLGSENFVAMIDFKTAANQNTTTIQRLFDHLLWYSRAKEHLKLRTLFRTRTETELSQAFDHVDQDGKRFHVLILDGRNAEEIARLAMANRLTADGRYGKRLEQDFPLVLYHNVWDDTVLSTYSKEKIYVVQTVLKVIERCLLMTTDPGDLVLDPTCGSGTTAYVAEQWGRRWITIDTSRVALALARTRLMAARFPYYLLADSPEGVKKESEVTGRTPPDYKTQWDIKKGFVYERVPHITLKSIANNPDIKEGMSRKQIDGAIARHAETETLYDQPYEDNKRVRVTGPFTVESLSPHRFISLHEEKPATERTAQKERSEGQFESMILEHLKKAGIQNTIKGEKLKFDRLETFAGEYIQAEGDYTDIDGKTRRVAVSIGPQYGTVGPDMVKEAAKEAVQGVGFHVLIVCGFAFDPHVSEEAKRYGKLTVLITRMNPDLSMGDELLKSTGSGNLFMVFGEPDIGLKKQKDGKFTVEIKGLDIYNPTTGQLSSNPVSEIACWFIDTDYNGESFFVRHAYFCGDDEPYEKLQRALRAEIDEAAWSSLYSTVSRPFDPPKTGKIAIKVINHYGDEVLKVYEVK